MKRSHSFSNKDSGSPGQAEAAAARADAEWAAGAEFTEQVVETDVKRVKIANRSVTVTHLVDPSLATPPSSADPTDPAGVDNQCTLPDTPHKPHGGIVDRLPINSPLEEDHDLTSPSLFAELHRTERERRRLEAHGRGALVKTRACKLKPLATPPALALYDELSPGTDFDTDGTDDTHDHAFRVPRDELSEEPEPLELNHHFLPRPDKIVHKAQARFPAHQASARLRCLVERDMALPSPSALESEPENLMLIKEVCITWLKECNWDWLWPAIAISGEMRWLAVRLFLLACHDFPICEGIDGRDFFGLAVAALSLSLKANVDAHRPLHMVNLGKMASWASRSIPEDLPTTFKSPFKFNELVLTEALVLKSAMVNYKVTPPTPWSLLEELVYVSPTFSILAKNFPDKWDDIEEGIEFELLNATQSDVFLCTSVSCLTAAAVYQSIECVCNFPYEKDPKSPGAFTNMQEIRQELQQLLYIPKDKLDSAIVMQNECYV